MRRNKSRRMMKCYLVAGSVIGCGCVGGMVSKPTDDRTSVVRAVHGSPDSPLPVPGTYL